MGTLKKGEKIWSSLLVHNNTKPKEVSFLELMLDNYFKTYKKTGGLHELISEDWTILYIHQNPFLDI